MSLAAAIEALYQAFAGYEAQPLFDCPCCQGQAALRRIETAHLRHHIHANDTLYWYDGQEFRHFLPRLFELATLDALDMDLPILGGALRRTGWETLWPAGERAAVENFLMAWWAHLLAGPDLDGTGVDACLATIGNATDAVEPYLAHWTRAIAGPTSPDAPDGLAPALANPADPGLAPALSDGVALLSPAFHHFVTFITYGWDGQSRRLRNAFSLPEPESRVLAWLESPELQAALRQAFQRTWDMPDFEAHARLFDQVVRFL